MGGNSRAVDRLTGEVKMFAGRHAYASPVDLKKIDQTKFKSDLLELLNKLNMISFSAPWINVNTNDCFIGSAKNFFDLPVGDFSKVKSMLGDIDVAVPEQSIEILWNLLEGLENKEIVSDVVYLGQNRKKLRKPSINAVFSWSGHFVQVDFVALPFRDDKLDAFSKFSHSSPWEDAKVGLKGVAHKFLLQTLAWATSHEENVVILTEKSPTFPQQNIRFKKMHEPPRMMSFCVDRGLRSRLIRVEGLFKAPLVVNGMNAYKELPTSVSDYITEPESIFMVLFGRRPDETDMIDFQSFVGLLRLCKKYLPIETVHMALDNLVRYKLFGNGQEMYRDSADADREVKDLIIKIAKDAYPSFTSGCPIVHLQKKYYETYKERKSDEY